MPLDENFPTYRYSHPTTTTTTTSKDATPTTTRIAFSSLGGPSQHLYTLTRSPTEANTYSITLSDAAFPDITYASLSCALSFSTSADSTPRVLRPSEFTLNLYNPSSAVTIIHKHSAIRGDYWQFRLPRSSFLPPTKSSIDASYRPPTPPANELLTFRWKKVGGLMTRPQLQCVLASHGKGDEPDLAVAMYYGLGDKAGKGEMSVYESNFRRVDCMDLKGLELVLVITARVINDVWWGDVAAAFNSPHVFAKQKGKSAAAPIPETIPKTTATTTTSTTDAQGRSFAQRFTALQSEDKILASPTPEELRVQRKIEKEQEEILRMLLAEEEAEKRRIEAETERLRRMVDAEKELLLQQQRQHEMQRRASVPPSPRQQQPRVVTYRPPPPRVVQPSRLGTVPRPHPAPMPPRMQSRPPVVGGWSAGVGLAAPQEGKRLDERSRRKSFLGLNFGGNGEEKEKEKKEKEKKEKEKEKDKKEKKGKLVKKQSSLW
ncbi:hypothetical protein FN846DRAFT_583727 [Sphaerosporella brunnea]|uniref:Uncharacterized protein n=1 Tax=Sphaerosporella brunnea TaxID=1250544 RepID=A0A5J5F2H7_9PEZI|nr:hypothetical protein FN846DRAFT_583727 [Sphaerosporella brunnea]